MEIFCAANAQRIHLVGFVKFMQKKQTIKSLKRMATPLENKVIGGKNDRNRKIVR